VVLFRKCRCSVIRGSREKQRSGWFIQTPAALLDAGTRLAVPQKSILHSQRSILIMGVKKRAWVEDKIQNSVRHRKVAFEIATLFPRSLPSFPSLSSVLSTEGNKGNEETGN